MHRTLWILAVLAGCKDNHAAASDPQRVPAPAKLSGVYPDQWKCEIIAGLDAIGQVLGGTAHQLDSALAVPHGVPHPCNYEILRPEAEYWTFDVDCRDGMKQRADALFAQYRDSSAEAVARFARIDAGVKPSDAGVARAAERTPERTPEPAIDVAVGARGLDHHGDGLLFIDDDAPCYIRVTGKDAARRLELARLIAKNLTIDNAPMTPRAHP
jgi:hypothetical protein